MDYLIRFVQAHETFRKPEIESLAELAAIKIQWIEYSEHSPFAIVRFLGDSDPAKSAELLLSRSILSIAIYELWGCGPDYASLHQDVRQRTEPQWASFGQQSFRFEMDTYQGTRSHADRRGIYDSFSYMAFPGPIVMSNPDHRFMVFEEYNPGSPEPLRLFFGRFVAESGRRAMTTYNLKKRKYISTTSMDAELSLVTANMALAGPGRLAYDPFMGTGSFPVACAHFGATVFGSDMDGRSIRGTSSRNVRTNFKQYGTSSLYLGGFAADLTNTPLQIRRFLDAIICDPPYGVREGLKVLGSNRADLQQAVILANGVPAHLQEGYIPPKKPYSFVRMLDDILDFASETLVDRGRLCMWMPVSGSAEDIDSHAETDEVAAEVAESPEVPIDMPLHPALELVSVCTQSFNKWSRRLLTYRRLAPDSVDQAALALYRTKRTGTGSTNGTGTTADELNDFRKQYFQGFKTPASVV